MREADERDGKDRGAKGEYGRGEQAPGVMKTPVLENFSKAGAD
jgi:hypothetical protein